MPTIVKCTGRPSRLLTAPLFVTLDPQSLNAWVGAGAKVVEVTSRVYDSMLAQVVKALDDADVVKAIQDADTSP